MKNIFNILLLFPILSIAQNAENSKLGTDLYFPANTFTDDILDNFVNEVYSMDLSSLHKLNLYKDSNQYEFYRLIYEANFRSIVELYKFNNSYILNVDSAVNDRFVHIRSDTLGLDEIENNIELMDSLVKELGKLGFFGKSPYGGVLNYCGHSWIIEIKKGDQYLVSCRRELEPEAIQVILIFMKFAKMSDSVINYFESDYKKF